MSAYNFGHKVSEVCAALSMGTAGALEIIKTVAIGTGTDGMKAFMEEGRVWYCEEYRLPPKTGLATMQKNKIKGVSRFYNYTRTVLRLAEKGETDKILTLKTSDFASKPARKTEEIADSTPEAADSPPVNSGAAPDSVQAAPYSIDDAIAAVETAADVGALTPQQMARLQALLVGFAHRARLTVETVTVQ